MNEQENRVPQPSAMSAKPAGFWVRFVAVMVDGVTLVVPVMVVQFIFGFVFAILFGASMIDGYSNIIAFLIQTLAYWLYFSLMTYYCGATLGKMLVGIKVQSADGSKLSFGQVVLRETIGKMASGIILFIGYLMAAFTDKKQALHDKIAKTVVIYKNPEKPHGAGLVVGIVIACILPGFAIIGILSSIVLVSLNTARQKGADAHIMANVQEIRVVLESDSDGRSYPDLTNANPVYGGLSSAAASSATLNPLIESINSLSKNGSVKIVNTPSSGSPVTGYAVYAPLATDIGHYFCVDSMGKTGRSETSNTSPTCQ